MTLEEEAFEYAKNDETKPYDFTISTLTDAFIAGANSKWVQVEKIKASLEPLYLMRDLRQNNGYFGGHDNGQVIDREIEKYEQQIKQVK